jgi:uncharacterized membrane protein YfcA
LGNKTRGHTSRPPAPKWAAPLSGGAAGLVNGFFGGGGGMVLVPMLTSLCRLTQQKAFATSVAVILPLCALSSGIYFFSGHLNLARALPYLLGGLCGGVIGGKIFRQMSVTWLRRAFALLILYGAWKSLL